MSENRPWFQPKRQPDFIIGEKSDPYMRRWWIIPRNRWFNIYLHQICKSDDDRALHDHPWWNVSILLRNAYWEIVPCKPGEDRGYWSANLPPTLKRHFRPSGSIIFRRATAAHRLELVHGPIWTLFVTGPVIREWGFLCPKGWRHHEEFAKVEGNNATVGKGCE